MSKSKKGVKQWLPVEQAHAEGRILNRWGNPIASIEYYYRLIKQGKIESKIDGNQIFILC